MCIHPAYQKSRDRRKRMRADTTGHSLAMEFVRFAKNSERLHRLFVETRKTIEEVRRGGYFNQEQQGHLSLTEEQSSIVSRAILGRVAILVFGQSCCAKAAVVNELFGSPILPVGVAEGPQDFWRMVTFQRGDQTGISLTMPDSAYELMEDLEAYTEGWQTIPRADLTIDGCEDPAKRAAILEVKIRNSLLRDNVQLIVSPSENSIERTFCRASDRGLCLPRVMIYAVEGETLSSEEESELRQLKARIGSDSVFFVGPKAARMCDLTESEQHARTQHNRSELFKQLQNLGFVLDRTNSEGPCSMLADSVETIRHSAPHTGKRQSVHIVPFVRRVLQWMVVEAANSLNEFQSSVLNMFIMSAFDFVRDRNITPMRIEYAKEKEAELYEKLLEIANSKQEEIRKLIVGTMEDLREEILDKCAHFEFVSISEADLTVASPATREKCAVQVQDYVLSVLSLAVADKLVRSVTLLRESFVGTLERCLATLEHACHNSPEETGHTVQASHALRQILNAAYSLEVTVRTSSSYLWVFLERMRRMFKDLPGRASPQIDADWKRRVATDLLESLSDTRLAKCICAQFRDKLKVSHERFTVAMAKLKADHDGRIDTIKNEKDKIRKVLAPRLARYSLEAVSLRDVILYGMPQPGREIGRGQYGVVYSCESWSMRGPLAIKSVVPPDDKHWNDLAMEFFYTRSLPPHERLVPLRGSVIDYNYGQGTPAVLLIMDKLTRDLHTALHQGLSFQMRMRIAQDVVQGIRYLHSQGLVHRDIKLKNVLLDGKHRAKITDLGFCKPNAMISGSVVGTPIHMAPELFTQKYDNRVDTYAFGILFWYLCSGKTDLPLTFADCADKDALWNNVRRGARPERLPTFSDACWELMSACWHQDPDQRPLLGDVENRIRDIAIKAGLREHDRSKDLSETMCSAEEAIGVDAKWLPLVH